MTRRSAPAGAASVGRSAPAADVAPILTIVLVAALGLAVAWFLPWWIMKARAPQYGQRTLVIEVGPRTVEGDVRELDMLGHYVGIRPLGTLARVERTLAPVGILGAIAGIVLAPWLRRRWLRLLAVLPVVVMPLILLVDLKLWMNEAVNDRDPNASLNLTVTRIDPKLFGEYEVGQFKVATELGAGFYAAGMAGLLGLGLVFAAPLGRRRATAALAAVLPLLAATDATAGPIADAVAAARPGETVYVPAGRHEEHLLLEKRLRLIGRSGAVLDGGGAGTVVRVAAAGVELRGLTIVGSGTSYTSEDAGVRIENAADVHIVDTRIEDTLFGIFALQADRCIVEGSTIVGKDLPHVRRGDGIRLWYSSGCRLVGNRVEQSRDVIIWYSAGTVVERNVVRTSRYGLHYMYSDHNRFHDNTFEDNQVGAAIMYSRDVELGGNSFSFSAGTAAYGLLLKDADDVFIVGNRFVHNTTGLFFDGAPQSRGGRVDVRGNLVARNVVGLALQPLSRGIRFWENELVGNGTQVQVLGTGSVEDNAWAVDGRGNYWSDAVVYDRDGDGISDLPYRSERTYEVLADRYPALAFFAGTPGAEAIDLAARLFPLFAPRPKLVDPHPLVRPVLAARGAGGTTPGDGGPFVLVGVALLATAGLGLAAGRRMLS